MKELRIVYCTVTVLAFIVCALVAVLTAVEGLWFITITMAFVDVALIAAAVYVLED
ncbi:hypothetical protein [Lacticaseibacillus mingshuiensis]|uniref:Uncharacterized protein n=1 Tax=Lacticaseibacillus mingshuiensis TaxID=2799574 RepID=A0ABW4CJP7_9LACO|nr:hypothetical protein [Lacticaseibacillus mingshuiensis]